MQLSLALMTVAAVIVVIVQCGDATVDPTDGDVINCTVHEDCPCGYSCILDQGICGKDNYAFECASDADCSPGYTCYTFAEATDCGSKCIPVEDSDGDEDEDVLPCTTDLDCEQDFICVNGSCQYANPPCKEDSDCWTDQCCVNDRCGDCLVDGDAVDGDEPIDGDEPVDGDEDGDMDNPDCESCQRSTDCSDGQVCGEGGCCMDSCEITGCPDGQSCNPNNGYCEWCDTTCPQGQCCNYHEDFWYCGSCCVPPCADGEACQGGRCVELSCPTCEPGQRCGADTGYICIDVDGPDGDIDGDVDRVFGGGECLPANSACIEGIDECCSGTCLMGTCL
jgi:hypothetical protein